MIRMAASGGFPDIVFLWPSTANRNEHIVVWKLTGESALVER